MGKQEDLVAAVKEQDLAALIKLTGKLSKSKLIGSAKKLNFNQADNDGFSLLHHAAAVSDNTEILKILIEHGATVDAMDGQGIRPLHVAARQGNVRSISHLVSCGSSVNDPAFDGSTPLHMACERGHLETVELLLNLQGDPSAYNCEHKSAFDVACEYGHLKIVEKLVCSPQCGPMVRDYRQKSRDVKRTTCLHLAAKNGHVNILRFLLEAGFDINQQTAHGTCLHESVIHSQIKVMKFLLDWGINIHTRNSFNQTALDVVHSAQKPQQTEKMFRLLTDAPFQPLTVRAIRPYVCPPQQHNQLTFREGDLIRVVERRSDEMWKGYLFRDSDVVQQHVGYFPSSEVEIVRTSDAAEDSLCSLRFPSPLAGRSSTQCLSPAHQAKSSPVSSTSDRVDRTAEWIVQSADAADRGSSGSPMSSKDNVSESNRSSTSSSSGSSGYLGSNSQVNTSGVYCLPNRLSGQSCESGVTSLWPSTHCLPASTSRSSHGGLEWPEESGLSGAPVSVNELIQQGLKDSDVMYIWLHQLQLTDCYQLFLQAGYDMPTISRMTPEDLTAIGITQPNVRKRLTSEISRLNLNDRIPNFVPSSVLEWLQMLNLEEYHATLMKDRYTTIDRVTDITWEDLEDIGINKLGHQKKFLLAIDRIKKLNSGKQGANECELPRNAEQKPCSSEMSGELRPSRPIINLQAAGSSDDNVPKHTPTKNQDYRNSSQAKNVIRLPPQMAFIHPSQMASRAAASQSTAPQPEMISIQVNRSACSRTGSLKEKNCNKNELQQVMCKSFHDNSTRELAVDGDATPTEGGSLSAEEVGDETLHLHVDYRQQMTPKHDPGSVRRASASATSVSGSTVTDVGYSFPNHCNKVFAHEANVCDVDRGKKHFDPTSSSVITYNSAPTTPSHSANAHHGHQSSSAGLPPKKSVPPPPKRSNSIKDKSAGGVKNAEITTVHQHSKSISDATHKAILGETAGMSNSVGSLSSTNVPDAAGSKAKFGSNMLTGEIDNPLTRVIARLEWKDDQVVRPAKGKEYPGRGSDAQYPAQPFSASAQAAHFNTDCNTLPFANENIGTIKQRNPSKQAATSGGNSGDRCGSQGVQITNSPGLRRSVQQTVEATASYNQLQQKPEARKPPPVPNKKPSLGKNDPSNDGREKQNPAAGSEGSDVFDDIDTLFQGLTQELNEMLTFNG